MPNDDADPMIDLGLALLLRSSPDYPRAVEELYCASLTPGSDHGSLLRALYEIGERYGLDGAGRQILLADVVMSLVGTLRVSVSAEGLVEFEAQIAERAAVARLADDVENFEDGAKLEDGDR